MLISTRGIVFRSLKYSESSLICTIYTEKRGLKKYIISGVRNKRAKVKVNLLRPMSVLDLVVYDRENQEINRIKEVKTALVYQSIPFEVAKGTIGLFITEIAHKSIREPEENLPLFHFLFDSYEFLDQTANAVANFPISFLANLCTYLGFAPNGRWEESTPFFNLQEGQFENSVTSHRYYLDEATSRLFSHFLTVPYEHIHRLNIPKPMRHRLLDAFIDYYKLHVAGFSEIHSHLVLREVME